MCTGGGGGGRVPVPVPGQRQHGTQWGRSPYRDGHQHHPQPETFRSAHMGMITQPQISVDIPFKGAQV